MVGALLGGLAAAQFTPQAFTAKGVQFGLYGNGRFGYAAAYPSGLMTPQAPPTNGDGRRFEGEGATLAVWGSYGPSVLGLDLRGYMAWVKKTSGDSVTYQAVGGDWFVLSGYVGDGPEKGRIYYERVIVKGGAEFAYRLTYEPGLRERYDPLIPVLNERLKPLTRKGG